MVVEASKVTISSGHPASPECRMLIEELDNYLASLYPAESNHLLPIETLCQPNVTFLTARIGTAVVGCAAFVNQNQQYAELKRMYVRPEYRGLKIGRRLLEELESRVREAGLEMARLETGVSQREVLSLCASTGYRRCGPFGDYREDPLSVFMEKRLN
jgi:putative acetyltransferase